MAIYRILWNGLPQGWHYITQRWHDIAHLNIKRTTVSPTENLGAKSQNDLLLGIWDRLFHLVKDGFLSHPRYTDMHLPHNIRCVIKQLGIKHVFSLPTKRETRYGAQNLDRGHYVCPLCNLDSKIQSTIHVEARHAMRSMRKFIDYSREDLAPFNSVTKIAGHKSMMPEILPSAATCLPVGPLKGSKVSRYCNSFTTGPIDSTGSISRTYITDT